jgi:hypothetical protein
MNQMQGGKNWIFPKRDEGEPVLLGLSDWLEIWSNHFCPSMGPNGGSVAIDSVLCCVQRGNLFHCHTYPVTISHLHHPPPPAFTLYQKWEKKIWSAQIISFATL